MNLLEKGHFDYIFKKELTILPTNGEALLAAVTVVYNENVLVQQIRCADFSLEVSGLYLYGQPVCEEGSGTRDYFKSWLCHHVFAEKLSVWFLATSTQFVQLFHQVSGAVYKGNWLHSLLSSVLFSHSGNLSKKLLYLTDCFVWIAFSIFKKLWLVGFFGET